MRMRRIVICGLPGSTKCCHIYIIKGKIFEKKVIEYTKCISSFSTTFVWNIFNCKENW